VFRQLALAQIIEPASTLEGLQVLEEAGAAASYRTVLWRLADPCVGGGPAAAVRGMCGGSMLGEPRCKGGQGCVAAHGQVGVRRRGPAVVGRAARNDLELMHSGIDACLLSSRALIDRRAHPDDLVISPGFARLSG
jgi:hypothetical protein